MASSLRTGTGRLLGSCSKFLRQLAMEDPTEMIRSSHIEGVIRKFFDVPEYRPYFGNVLNPLICALRASTILDPAVHRVLAEAMDLEDFLIQRGLLDPLYAAFVARPSLASQLVEEAT